MKYETYEAFKLALPMFVEFIEECELEMDQAKAQSREVLRRVIEASDSSDADVLQWFHAMYQHVKGAETQHNLLRKSILPIPEDDPQRQEKMMAIGTAQSVCNLMHIGYQAMIESAVNMLNVLKENEDDV